jgi:hypothetical protein
MIPIIYLFALLTAPADKYICDLWTRAITQKNMMEACGTLQVEGYRVDVYDLEMDLLCTRPGSALMDIMNECDLESPLDQYVLRIVEPGFSTLICFVESEHEDKPTTEEVQTQCPWSPPHIVKFIGTKPEEILSPFTCPARDIAIGPGLYDQASSAALLHTSEDLTWLAGRLIWGGMVKTECGGSGLYPVTFTANPCGLTYARSTVIHWQNQFDDEIYAAAIRHNVPARLLKRMIMIESQFWPFYKPTAANEVSVMQITDNGLDTLLRFDPSIDPGYITRDDTAKFWARSTVRDTLTCVSCHIEEAIEKINSDMDLYARLLAAFHCRAVTVNPALVGDQAWRQAVVDYNGSARYLERIENTWP